MDVVMDIEKSRKFYQDRYHKAIEQFGENSLTASICRKKLELLGTIIKQHANDSAASIGAQSVFNAETNEAGS